MTKRDSPSETSRDSPSAGVEQRPSPARRKVPFSISEQLSEVALRLRLLFDADDAPATHHRQFESEPRRLLPEVGLPGERSAEGLEGHAAPQSSLARTAPSSRRGFAGHGILRQSDYQIQRRLGEGSFAHVFSASWHHCTAPAAIKKVRPAADFDKSTRLDYADIVETLRHELAVLKKLGTHANVVTVLSASSDGSAFAMPQAHTDLFRLIKHKHGSLSLLQMQTWTQELMRAVSHVHAHGVIHQDIKSSNILLTADASSAATYRAVVCDFGLSREHEIGCSSSQVDREIITLWYRPPELLMGASQYSNKVDMWGVGCVMLEMLAGEPPFCGKLDASCSCSNQKQHANFNSDQLCCIFKILGTPKAGTYGMTGELACLSHYSSWPKYPAKLSESVHSGISSLSSDGISAHHISRWQSLILQLLCLDPSTRCSASAALEHPLFHPLLPPPTRGGSDVGDSGARVRGGRDGRSSEPTLAALQHQPQITLLTSARSCPKNAAKEAPSQYLQAHFLLPSAGINGTAAVEEVVTAEHLLELEAAAEEAEEADVAVEEEDMVLLELRISRMRERSDGMQHDAARLELLQAHRQLQRDQCYQQQALHYDASLHLLLHQKLEQEELRHDALQRQLPNREVHFEVAYMEPEVAYMEPEVALKGPRAQQQEQRKHADSAEEFSPAELSRQYLLHSPPALYSPTHPSSPTQSFPPAPSSPIVPVLKRGELREEEPERSVGGGGIMFWPPKKGLERGEPRMTRSGGGGVSGVVFTLSERAASLRHVRSEGALSALLTAFDIASSVRETGTSLYCTPPRLKQAICANPLCPPQRRTCVEDRGEPASTCVGERGLPTSATNVSQHTRKSAIAHVEMLLLFSASRNSQTGDSLAEGGEGRGERRGRGGGRDKEAALNMQGQSDATLVFSLAHTPPPSEIDAAKMQRRVGERERGGGGAEEKGRESVYEAYENFWREQTEREGGGGGIDRERQSNAAARVQGWC
jgi:serine/threonine protein kinase